MLGFGDNLAQSLAALRAYRLRSALTIIGLVMGVATIIAVISLIQGANHYVEERIANLGTNVFQIAKTPFVTTNFDLLVKALRFRKLDYADLEALTAQCRDCEATGATATGQVPMHYRAREIEDARMFGHTPSMAVIDSRVVNEGRYFTPAEEQRSAYVCLIGDSVSSQFFGGAGAVGQTIRLAQQEFTVIGSFEKIGAVLGQDSDTFVVVPLRTFLRLRGTRTSLTLNVKAPSPALFASVMDESKQLLRARRHLAPSQPDDFFFGTKESYMALWASLSGAFMIAFVLVSGITVTVGGIVIMNVMLVSVTERAKEIGLRRALGASRGDIWRQFLIESLMQCLAGGVVGVGAGFVAAELVRRFTSFPVTVEWWVAAFGIALSSAVGLCFGIAPAMSAARMDPVEALRSE